MQNSKKIYRVLDANQNRLREALRVLEDIARFTIASPALARDYKKVRHKVTQQLLKLPVSYRLIVTARDSERDVGRNSFQIDKRKENLEDVAIRNLKRAQEATRVLEEFLKLINTKLAFQFQKIRFQIYELEKKTLKKI